MAGVLTGISFLGPFSVFDRDKTAVSPTVKFPFEKDYPWVNDLKDDFNDPDSATIGTEFGCTSISSGGDGTDLHSGGKATMAANPHTKFANGQRGYVLCKVTCDHWRTDFRVVPYVLKPNAPVITRASFVVEKGKPGAVEV